MASPAKFTIRVRSARNSSDISVSTTGVYKGLAVNTITIDLPLSAVQPTASPKVFWTSVLTAVQAQLATM